MIVVRLKGGMGNQMFQYACARALSLWHNVPLGLDVSFYDDPGIPVRTYDLDLFSIHAKVLSQNEIPHIYRTYGTGIVAKILRKIQQKFFPMKGTERSFAFDATLSEKGRNLYLDGYWQSPKYFDKYADVIRADFTVQELPTNIAERKEAIAAQEAVCVHIRRGDYVGNAYHDVVTNDHYVNALAIIAEKKHIDSVYVFSDDIAWCKENLSFAYPTEFVDDTYAGERGIGHFELMRSCKHFVIPNSSFSWWAAWLAQNSEKIVIAPKQWFGDSSIDTKDLIPENWIRI